MPDDFPLDQAAGLRRIMAGSKPRLLSIVSAATGNDALAEKSRLVSNLAASLAGQQAQVMIVTANSPRHVIRGYGLDALPSLLDVVNQRISLEYVIEPSDHGYVAANLSHAKLGDHYLGGLVMGELNRVFARLTQQYEVVLVDTTLNDDNTLPLTALNNSEIVIHLNNEPQSIKQAYAIIKQICSQLGKRPFSILVSDANEIESERVFRNMAQVARQFLQVNLEFLGTIPTDDHISRAAKLGRAVIDAFPMANASKAFRVLAKRLDYKQDLSKMVGHASFS